jgi:hypothetical protein
MNFSAAQRYRFSRPHGTTMLHARACSGPQPSPPAFEAVPVGGDGCSGNIRNTFCGYPWPDSDGASFWMLLPLRGITPAERVHEDV